MRPQSSSAVNSALADTALSTALNVGPSGPVATTVADPYAVLPAQQPPTDPVEDAYRRALRSPVVAASGNDGTSNPGPMHGVSTLTSAVDSANGMQSGFASAQIGGGTRGDFRGLVGSTASTSSDAVPPRITGMLDRGRTVAGVSEVSNNFTVASSPFRLDAGTVIPAALIMSVNSSLPGPIVAQVTRNVYDSRTQRILLIPQGTRLIGRHETQVGAGQNRLMVAWTRMILPDDRSLTLPDVGATDTHGASGIPGTVDDHYRRTFGTALLMSIISAGVQLSQPQQSAIGYGAPSARHVAAGAVGQQLSDVGLEALRRNLDIGPTLTLPEATPLNVLLSGDLVLPGAYAPAGR